MLSRIYAPIYICAIHSPTLAHSPNSETGFSLSQVELHNISVSFADGDEEVSPEGATAEAEWADTRRRRWAARAQDTRGRLLWVQRGVCCSLSGMGGCTVAIGAEHERLWPII